MAGGEGGRGWVLCMGFLVLGVGVLGMEFLVLGVRCLGLVFGVRVSF